MYIKITDKTKYSGFLALCEQHGYKQNNNIPNAKFGDYIFINYDVKPFIPLAGAGAFGSKWIMLYSTTNEEFGNNFWDIQKDWDKIVDRYFRKI